MATSVRSLSAPVRRRAVKPARLDSLTCILKPTYPCDLLTPGQTGIVEINGERYWLVCHGRTTRCGYRLAKFRDGAVYDLDTSSGHPVCDCPDYVARRGTAESPYCKHCLACLKLRRDGVI